MVKCYFNKISDCIALQPLSNECAALISFMVNIDALLKYLD